MARPVAIRIQSLEHYYVRRMAFSFTDDMRQVAYDIWRGNVWHAMQSLLQRERGHIHPVILLICPLFSRSFRLFVHRGTGCSQPCALLFSGFARTILRTSQEQVQTTKSCKCAHRRGFRTTVTLESPSPCMVAQAYHFWQTGGKRASKNVTLSAPAISTPSSSRVIFAGLSSLPTVTTFALSKIKLFRGVNACAKRGVLNPACPQLHTTEHPGRLRGIKKRWSPHGCQ